MFARITRVASAPERLEEGAATFERELLPQIKDLPGFVGAAALGDRQAGRAASVTYWASEEAMRGSEEAASKTRSQVIQSGSTLIDLEHYEMVIVERAAPPQANTFVRSNTAHVSVDKLDAADREASQTAVSDVGREVRQLAGVTDSSTEQYEVFFSEVKQAVTTG